MDKNTVEQQYDERVRGEITGSTTELTILTAPPSNPTPAYEMSLAVCVCVCVSRVTGQCEKDRHHVDLLSGVK